MRARLALQLLPPHLKRSHSILAWSKPSPALGPAMAQWRALLRVSIAAATARGLTQAARSSLSVLSQQLAQFFPAGAVVVAVPGQ
jgi:hypothetical protein